MAAERSSPWRVAAVVAFYWITSMAVVFLNKFIMNYSSTAFPFPIMLTWIQFVVALLCLVVVSLIKPIIPGLSFFPTMDLKWKTCLNVFPLTMVYLGMIVCNNICLQHVDIGFYQVARSLTVVFATLHVRFLSKIPMHKNAYIACCVVVVGYLIAFWGEIQFSWTGAVFGLLASFFVALYAVMVKSTMPLVGNCQWKLLWYNTLLATVLCIPTIFAAGEFEDLVSFSSNGHIFSLSLSAVHPLLLEESFWMAAITAGLTGFLINIAIFYQIRYTSPLTHNVSGTAKACVQTILGTLIAGHSASPLFFLGTALCIAGSTWYAHAKSQKSLKKTE